VLDHCFHLPGLRRAAMARSIQRARERRDTHPNTFTGFPIPAAAGLIASITLSSFGSAEGEHHLGNLEIRSPPLLLFLPS